VAITPRDGRGVAAGLLRLGIGATMIAHGVRHGRTLEGTARWFGSIGYREPKLQAQASTVVEIGSGAAILAGAATPLASSAVIGTMAVAAQTVHRPNGFFVVNDGWEYAAFMAAGAAALAAIGPGRWSIDQAFGLHRGTGATRAAIAIGLGLAGAAVQLKTFWTKPEPKPVA
jgi:putative oxidoreductase